MIKRIASGLIIAVIVLAPAPPAQAHIVAIRLGDFYAGALHPFTDLQDVLLWLALGVLAGSLGAMRGRWLVLVFPLGLLTGLTMAPALRDATADTAVNAGLTVLLGLLLAAAARVPTALLCVLAFVLAVLRGAANAADLEANTDRVLFGAGLVCTGYAAITLVMALTAAFRGTAAATTTSWRGIALRALGGWIAAIGLMMAGLAFAA
jgi:urease accessory protein